MKKKLLLILLILGSFFNSFLTFDLSAQEHIRESKDSESFLLYDTQMWNRTENELWKLEEAYMLNYMEKNLDILSTFWHEKFVGWPSSALKPLDRENAISILRQSQNSETKSFKIKPQKIVLIDTIAVVHYLIDIEQESEEMEKIKTTFRVIHTWLKQNGKWKILSGMSAKP